MANKKVVSVLSTAAIGTLIATAVGSTVFAAVDGLVVKNAAGAYLNYDLDALKASVVNDALGQAGAELYKDFDASRTAGSIVSYHDNKVGFVDAAAVQKAALDAALAGTSFKLDTFTESSIETVLPATVYQATVTNGKVVAGAEVKPTTTPVATALAVDSVSAISPIKLQVKFNKAVNATTAVNPAYYSIDKVDLFTAFGLTSSSLALSADKTAVTITLPVGSALASGTTYQIGVSKLITDAASVAMTDNYATLYKFSDTTAPALGAVTYTNNNTAKVTFSEPMSIITTAQVQVLDDKGVDVTSGTLGLGANTLAGDTNLNIDLTGATVNKVYTVYVYGASDLSGNLAGTKTFTVTKTNADVTAPTVQSIVAKSLDTFVVTFSEPVATDATTVANGYGDYTVGGVSGKLIAGDVGLAAAPVLSTDKTQLTVQLAVPVAAGLYSASLNNFLDLSQNKQTTAYTKVIDFQADTTAPKVLSTTVQNIGGTDCLLVKFDDAALVAGAVAANNAITTAKYVKDNVEYSLSGITNPAVPFGTASLYDPDGDGKTDTVKVTLPANLTSGSYTVTLAASAAKDASNNASVATPITFNYAPSATSIKPAVADNDAVITNGIGGGSFVQAGNDVTIKFTKDVTSATALNVNNYLVDGQVVFSKAIFVGDNKTVRLTLNQDAIKATASRSFTVQNVADANGNVMNTVTFNQAFTENVAPTIKSATLTAADKITLTFSEAVKASTALGEVDDADFDIYIDGVKVTQTGFVSAISDTVTGTTVTLTLANPLTTSADLAKTITVKTSAANDVVDANGNAEASATVTVAK